MHPTDDLVSRGMMAVAKAASPKAEEPVRPLAADDVRAIVEDVVRREMAHLRLEMRAISQSPFQPIGDVRLVEAIRGKAVMSLGQVRMASDYVRHTR